MAQKTKSGFSLILKGMRFGNAFSERGTKNVQDIKTRLTRNGSDYVLNGQKFYSTRALFAHWIPVLCLMDVNGEDKPAIAHLERDSEGVNGRIEPRSPLAECPRSYSSRSISVEVLCGW